MKYAFLFLSSLFFALLSPLTHLQAQDKDSSSVYIIPEGSKAIQFGVSGLVRLTSFSGATFSYKKQITSTRAKRISFRTNSSYIKAKHPDRAREPRENILNLDFGLEYTWMNYLNPASEIKFYYGLGPGVDFAYRKIKSKNETSTAQRKSMRVGLSGIGYFGFEWFFKPRMSLHAEYRALLKVEYTTEMRDDERISGEKMREYETEIILRGEPVLFGLSVYF